MRDSAYPGSYNFLAICGLVTFTRSRYNRPPGSPKTGLLPGFNTLFLAPARNGACCHPGKCASTYRYVGPPGSHNATRYPVAAHPQDSRLRGNDVIFGELCHFRTQEVPYFRQGKKDANIAVKYLTSSNLSGIVRALAARYGFPVSGRAFESRVVNDTVMQLHRPL